MLEIILRYALVGAVVVGISGFLIGFVGPMIFMPDSNQGPLIGIFVTGPLGVVAGFVGGALMGWRAGRKAPR